MPDTNEDVDNRHIGIGKTLSFPNLYKHFKDNAIYDFTEEFSREPEEHEIKLPVLEFHGSEKLHGTNMAVCFDGKDHWVQGRNRVVTLDNDQDAMAHDVAKKIHYWEELKQEVIRRYMLDATKYVICLDAEWAGGNIQKNNSACSNVPKAAYLFDYARALNKETGEITFFQTHGIAYPEQGVYNLYDFGAYTAVLDFNNPEECEMTLDRLVKEVEENSPVAKYFNKEGNVGEGVFLISWHNDVIVKLKAKGEKHTAKTKRRGVQKVSRTSEEEQRLQEFADKVTPVWRIEQAIKATDAKSLKDMGKILAWVSKDVIDEEQPLINTSEFEWVDMKRAVAARVKRYVLSSFKSY